MLATHTTHLQWLYLADLPHLYHSISYLIEHGTITFLHEFQNLAGFLDHGCGRAYLSDALAKHIDCGLHHRSHHAIQDLVVIPAMGSQASVVIQDLVAIRLLQAFLVILLLLALVVIQVSQAILLLLA